MSGTGQLRGMVKQQHLTLGYPLWDEWLEGCPRPADDVVLEAVVSGRITQREESLDEYRARMKRERERSA